jgi:hypothetical protein
VFGHHLCWRDEGGQFVLQGKILMGMHQMKMYVHVQSELQIHMNTSSETVTNIFRSSV